MIAFHDLQVEQEDGDKGWKDVEEKPISKNSEFTQVSSWWNSMLLLTLTITDLKLRP